MWCIHQAYKIESSNDIDLSNSGPLDGAVLTMQFRGVLTAFLCEAHIYTHIAIMRPIRHYTVAVSYKQVINKLSKLCGRRRQFQYVYIG